MGGKIKRDLQNIERAERGLDFIDLAQERDRLWAIVNTVMNFRVP